MVSTTNANGRAMPRLRHRSSFASADEGGATLEFAIVAPIFLMIMLAIVQLAFVFADYMFLTSAVMAGSQTISVSRGITTPWTSTVSAMVASAPLLDAVQLKARITIKVNGSTCATNAGCASSLTASTGGTAVVTATYPCNLTILGVNYASGCVLVSQVAQVVQ